jgi:hypothetical protein
MPSTLGPLPLRDQPTHWRPLVALELVAVGALVASMLVTLATPDRGVGAPARVYESLLVTVVFWLPPAVGLATGVLDGGVLWAVALAAFPSLAWTFSVPAGYALRLALSHPLPIADSPLWAISGAFLGFGLLAGGTGYALGRAARLLRDRFRGRTPT